MKRTGFASGLGVLLSIAPAFAQELELDFGARGPAPGLGPDHVRVVARLLIASPDIQVQGWSVVIGSRDCEIVGATVDGTVAEDRSDGGPGCIDHGGFTFERTFIGTEAASGDSFVNSAIVMSCDLVAEGSPHDLLVVTARQTPEADPCGDCTFFYEIGPVLVESDAFDQPRTVETSVVDRGKTREFSVSTATVNPCGRRFRRGDCNDDGAVNISDVVFVLNSLFLPNSDRPCDDACDADDDGFVNLGDAMVALGLLFLGAGGLPPPGPLGCGVDPTGDQLDCAAVGLCG